jgi:hypothetical protein
MTNLNKPSSIRMADADESPSRIDVDYIDRKYKEWLVRRGFSDELGNVLGMRRPNGRRGKRIDPDEI